MNSYRILSFLMIVITAGLGCVSPNTTFEKIPPGIWRGVLLLDRKPIMEYGDDRDVEKKFSVESELPFNFEVIYDTDTSFHIVLMNAEERIEVRDIRFGRDKSTGKDTVYIDFPVFDTSVKAIYEDGVMEGDWIVHYRDNYRIPFKAVHGNDKRFDMTINAVTDSVTGQWDCTFAEGEDDEYKAVGLFTQNGSKVTGTFLTETGDYRFLEGCLNGKKLYLSSFDGAHAFLFLGKLLPDGSITGTFRSGSHYTTNWSGKRSLGSLALRDPYTLTKMRRSEPLSFSFPDTEGKPVQLSDARFANRPKIIQIMGTWCPNCLDETRFLLEELKERVPDDIAYISICFERYKDREKAINVLKRYKAKMNLTHDILYGGYFDKKEAARQIPQLDTLLSYPTLLFVDKNNNVQSIHTGFSGPATPGYTAFKEEFSRKINGLLEE